MRPIPRRRITPIIITVFLSGLLALNITDILSVLNSPEEYPFGSEFFSRISIYRSKAIYLWYQGITALCLLLTIFALFRFRGDWRYVLLILNLLLLCYPMLTS
ncbi:MAG: hypothetical protein P0Y53_03570 [Candidatus Pseudobacter hemicellulosilyticus]|uniref:Uncharacterized protein n=1 Tax=Candidatus Pseudobacter hemicellulosilyticus TaxID=3121375 RepID=A0AAJ5WUX8_9BACT|nr:MAG: hypothetical protein P0Y53_03570 [Pseudobacter sp.]